MSKAVTDILEQPIKPSPDAFANAIGDELVLLQVKHGIYFGLDPIGTRIWAGLSDGRSPHVICAEVAAEYAVPIETVEADARKFLEELKANEIIVVE